MSGDVPEELDPKTKILMQEYLSRLVGGWAAVFGAVNVVGAVGMFIVFYFWVADASVEKIREKILDTSEISKTIEDAREKLALTSAKSVLAGESYSTLQSKLTSLNSEVEALGNKENADRLAQFAKTISEHPEIATALTQLGSAKLDCKTEVLHSPSSNNFTTSIRTPPGFKLVGGSCHFDEWQNGDVPTLIQVGPGDDSGLAWTCYAKQPRAVPFTTTATFCRIAGSSG